MVFVPASLILTNYFLPLSEALGVRNKMKNISIIGLILLFVALSFNAVASEEEFSCQELTAHLENAKKTESFLMVTKFNRDSTVTIEENDGHLWDLWQKVQRLKKEKELLFHKKKCGN